MNKSKAEQLADDRPTDTDHLYDWAITAEEMLHEQAKVIAKMKLAAEKFTIKVQTGRAKSVETYDDMQEVLRLIQKLEV